MLSLFEELIIDLGKELDIPLHSDDNNACVILIEETLSVQLELDDTQSKLLIASFLCEVSAGKYRENVLKCALKANDEKSEIGTFAYHEKSSQLTLFSYLQLEQISKDVLKEYLQHFIEKSMLWKDAIENGNLNLIEEPYIKPKDGISPMNLS
jgi:hypothetical protein